MDKCASGLLLLYFSNFYFNCKRVLAGSSGTTIRHNTQKEHTPHKITHRAQTKHRTQNYTNNKYTTHNEYNANTSTTTIKCVFNL
jgi:hypothetical protein